MKIAKNYLLLLIIILVFAAGLYLGKYGSLNKVTIQQAPQKQATDDDTANWNTYQGNGFTFRLPLHYLLIEEIKGKTTWKAEFIPGKFNYNALILNSQNKPYKEPAKEDFFEVNTYQISGSKTYPIHQKITANVTYGNLIQEEIGMGTKKTKDYFLHCGPDCNYFISNFDSKGKYYQLIYYLRGAGSNRILNQILQTFRFD